MAGFRRSSKASKQQYQHNQESVPGSPLPAQIYLNVIKACIEHPCFSNPPRQLCQTIILDTPLLSPMLLNGSWDEL